MVAEWSRGGRGGSGYGGRVATGRSETFKTFVALTTGRSQASCSTLCWRCVRLHLGCFCHINTAIETSLDSLFYFYRTVIFKNIFSLILHQFSKKGSLKATLPFRKDMARRVLTIARPKNGRDVACYVSSIIHLKNKKVKLYIQSRTSCPHHPTGREF